MPFSDHVISCSARTGRLRKTGIWSDALGYSGIRRGEIQGEELKKVKAMKKGPGYRGGMEAHKTQKKAVWRR